MTIEFNDNTLGIWYVAFEGRDWMCGLTREGERYRFDYRIRHYNDPVDPWDGKDRKSWYTGTVDAPRQEVIEKLRQMAAMMNMTMGGQAMYECVRAVDEPLEAYVERFKQLPFVHMRQVSEEEYQREYGDKAKVPKP